uniref:Angiotensin-converting enzyme n=1 Tax=Tityus obscurus TaxID=1221240 RepID=A0A1E1WVT7_TITOB
MQNISIAQLRADNTTDNDTKLLANTSNFEIGDISSLLKSILNDSFDVENTIEVNNSSGNTSGILTIVEIAEEAMKASVVIDEEDAIEFLIKQEFGSLECWVNSDHNMTIHKELNVENDTETHIKNYFLILSDGSYGNVDWRKLAKLGRAKKFMLNRYWSARIIPYYLRGLSKKFWRKQYPLMGVIGLRREFALSRNFNELKYYWTKWRDITGKSMKRKFLTYIHANKYNIKSNGEKLFIKEENSLRVQIDKVYQQILPLYIRLHSYVRKRLLLKYGYRRIHKSGPIPAHLLGDISAHDWSNIENLLRPYPNKYALEICKNVKERNVSAEEIAKIAENFYISLGFDKMDKKFWDNSIFEAYSKNCTKSFSVKCDNDTSGIHACIDPDCYFFSMFHWGTFAQQLKHNATISPVISEAISKAVGLSVSKPGYLYSVGLSDIMIYDRYDEINFLMETALRVIPSIMDSLSVGLWKRKIMEGLISHGNMNENFWKHRLYYQGLCPPVVRTERHFDAGAVKSIANDLNVMNEFLSGILQFQIYKSLCNSSVPGDVLHRCTLHNSTEVGKRIMKLLTLGKPVTIMDAISVLTDGDKEIEAQPMIEYFKPLYKWFLKRDKFDDIGWESYDASVCPKCAF